MVDVRGDILWPPHCTTPAAVKANKNQNIYIENAGTDWTLKQE